MLNGPAECWVLDNTTLLRPLSGKNSKNEFYSAQGDGYMKVRINDINLSELDDADDYYHCQVEQSASGVIQLMPMPYRAVPFPKVAVKIHTGMRDKTLNKVWAISADGKYTFFSNDNTDFNLVCCEINDKASIGDRINGKLEKGYYIDKSINIYDADERDLV